MGNLIYNRTATVSRSTLVKDSLNGARMTPVAVLSAMPCSIQPGRDRNVKSTALPAGMQSVSVDGLPAWMMYCKPKERIATGDTVLDDLGRSFIVAAVYETPFGAKCVLETVSP